MIEKLKKALGIKSAKTEEASKPKKSHGTVHLSTPTSSNSFNHTRGVTHDQVTPLTPNAYIISNVSSNFDRPSSTSCDSSTSSSHSAPSYSSGSSYDSGSSYSSCD